MRFRSRGSADLEGPSHLTEIFAARRDSGAHDVATGRQQPHVGHRFGERRPATRTVRDGGVRADERGTLLGRGDLELDVRVREAICVALEIQLQREPLRVADAFERNHRLRVRLGGQPYQQGSVAGEGAEPHLASLGLVLNRAHVTGAVDDGEPHGVGAARHGKAERERQPIVHGRTERPLLGCHVIARTVAERHQERDLTTGEVRRLSGQHQPDSRRVIAVGRGIAREPQADPRGRRR